MNDFRNSLSIINQIAPRKSAKLKTSPPKLQNATQKTALLLLKKEEANAKRGRLECLLQQQFCYKYGTKSKSSDVNEYIQNEIKQFVISYDDLNAVEANIDQLEHSIRENVTRIKEAKRTSRQQESRDKQLPRLTVAKLGYERSDISHFKENGDDVSPPLMRKIEENQWPVINAILAVSDEQKNRIEKQKELERKQRFQQDLHQQIETNKERVKIAQEEKQLLLQRNRLNYETYERDMEQMRQNKIEKFHMEKQMRELQIEENKLVKERERQLRIAQERAEMLRAKKLAEDEEEVKWQAKQRQKAMQDALLVENEHNKKIKAEALRERQEYEKKLNKDYE
jgi:hypothetical protein